ncbi:MAG: O-antigen ligase family protein [Thermoleophilia bacterium]
MNPAAIAGAVLLARARAREHADMIVLVGGLGLTLLVSLLIAQRWSAALAGGLVLALAGALLYVGRPGLFICASLLPFALLDEATPDAVPSLDRIAGELYSDRANGYLAPRDLLLALGVFAAANWFPPAERRAARTFGRVTWVMIAAGGMIAACLVVGYYVLDRPAASVVALRPFYTCVAAAYIVWRLLRWMTAERAERAVFTASLVTGGLIIALGAARVAGLAGTAVDIDGVPITFYDATTPFLLLACVGVWAAWIAGRRVEGRARLALGAAVLAGVLVAIASQRRAVLLGYLAAALVLLVVNAVRKRGGVRRSLKITFAVLAVTAVALLLVSAVVPGARELLVERAQSALQAGEQRSSADSSLQFRVQESDAVYALAGRHLWDGIGPGVGFTPVNGIFMPLDGSYIHNTYFALPLRYGLWGILALTVLVVGLTLRVIRGVYRDPPMMAWSLGAAPIAMLPAIATAAFLTQTVRWPIVLGVLIGAFDALSEPDLEPMPDLAAARAAAVARA